MSQDVWNFIFIGITFGIYIGIALWAKAGSTKDYYTAGGGVSAISKWYGDCCGLDVSGDIYIYGRLSSCKWL